MMFHVVVLFHELGTQTKSWFKSKRAVWLPIDQSHVKLGPLALSQIMEDASKVGHQRVRTPDMDIARVGPYT